MAIVTSTMGSRVCRPVTRGSDMCGSGLVSGWTGLTAEPCSVGLALGQGLAFRSANSRLSGVLVSVAPARFLGEFL